MDHQYQGELAFWLDSHIHVQRVSVSNDNTFDLISLENPSEYIQKGLQCCLEGINYIKVKMELSKPLKVKRLSRG